MNERVLKIAVIGDAMVDAYHIGRATRLSAEAPIPVVAIDAVRYFPGGAANVAENLKAFGAAVKTYFCEYADRPRKNRLMVGDVQVARWDEQDVCEALAGLDGLAGADGICISDYGKGACGPAVVQALQAFRDIPIFIDCKNPYKYGHLPQATFFPNRREYEAHPMFYGAAGTIRTDGADGMYNIRTDRHIPALARSVQSVNGAGDTVLAAYAYATLTGDPDPMLFAAHAAACVVEKPYTATATLKEVHDRYSSASILV